MLPVNFRRNTIVLYGLLASLSTAHGMIQRASKPVIRALATAATHHKPKAFGTLTTPPYIRTTQRQAPLRTNTTDAEENFAKKFASISTKYTAPAAMYVAPTTEAKNAQQSSAMSLTDESKQEIFTWLKQNTFDTNDQKLWVALKFMQADPKFAAQVIDLAKEQIATLTDEQKAQLKTHINELLGADSPLSDGDLIMMAIISPICLYALLALIIIPLIEDVTGTEDLAYKAWNAIKNLTNHHHPKHNDGQPTTNS